MRDNVSSRISNLVFTPTFHIVYKWMSDIHARHFDLVRILEPTEFSQIVESKIRESRKNL